MTVRMNTSVYSSPIRTYMDNYHKMRVSHDEDRSDPKDLGSLGVVDLDLSLSTDEYGLRAFDSKKQLTQMLPGSIPCELRLMSLKIWPHPLFGGHGMFPQRMSLLFVDDGRRPSLGLCRNDQRRWSDSVGLLVVDQRGTLWVGSLAGGWLGRVPSLRKDRPPHFVLLAPDALFGIPRIVPLTMLRHPASLAFL